MTGTDLIIAAVFALAACSTVFNIYRTGRSRRRRYRVAPAPPGTHWRFHDHKILGADFSQMQLVDDVTGDKLGDFYVNVYSNRLEFWLGSRGVIKEYRRRHKNELRRREMMNGPWEVTEERYP